LLGAGELAVIGSQLSVEKADSSAALRNDKQMALRNDKQEAAISFLAMDVSFISATLVLPAVLRALVREGERWRGEAVVLVKPQFEAGREHVGKGGIVREQAGREIAIERVRECVVGLGGDGSAGTGVEVIDSPIHGMEGNWEYLLHAWFGEANA
jgi:23S rRNA (cytidine1920-2'-O)/16S rRNA (cytidine1409-2'-O)-methyltransferase